jgi:hypothetical protein
MGHKTEHAVTVHNGSAAKRRKERRCVPVVAKLEDRSLLSTFGAPVAYGAAMNVGPRVAEIAAANAHLAHQEALLAAREARAAYAIHFPGGSVHIKRHGTHVTFPGGSVRAGRFGAVVTFPGGFVIAGFGHTVVKFPGGFINI